jgi:hypothetical protein
LGFLVRTSVNLEEIVANDGNLRDLNAWYQRHAPESGIGTKVFFENEPTHGSMRVSQSSANPNVSGVTPVAVDANHNEISRPRSRESVVYLGTLGFVDEVIPGVRGTVAPPDPAEAAERLAATVKRDTPLRRLWSPVWAGVVLMALAIAAFVAFGLPALLPDPGPTTFSHTKTFTADGVVDLDSNNNVGKDDINADLFITWSSVSSALVMETGRGKVVYALGDAANASRANSLENCAAAIKAAVSEQMPIIVIGEGRVFLLCVRTGSGGISTVTAGLSTDPFSKEAKLKLEYRTRR